MVLRLRVRTFFSAVSLVLIFFFLPLSPAHAGDVGDASPIIHYKGQLPESTVGLLRGKLTSLTFELYDAEDEGKRLWHETQDILISSTGSFHVLLGNVTPFSTVPGELDTLFPDSPRWLRITTKAGQELVSVQQLMSATGNTLFRLACPEDMSDLGTFCIDKTPVRSTVSWYIAAEKCEVQEKRLCTNTEWLDACDTSPPNGVEQLPPPKDESEWLANWVFETSSRVFSSIDRGYYRCITESHPWPSDRPYAIKWYRCCK